MTPPPMQSATSVVVMFMSKAHKERIAWLETTNEDLGRELDEYRSSFSLLEKFTPESQVITIRRLDEEAAKEWEHTMLQDTMGRELNELNTCLEQKEANVLDELGISIKFIGVGAGFYDLQPFDAEAFADVIIT